MARVEFRFEPQWAPTSVGFDVALDDCIDGALTLTLANGDGARSQGYAIDLPSLFDQPHALQTTGTGAAAAAASAEPDDPHGTWPQDGVGDLGGHGTSAAWPAATAKSTTSSASASGSSTSHVS